MKDEIRLASTIMLIQEADALEVLMMKRYQHDGLLSGAMLFPGGKLEHHDSAPDWADLALNWGAVPEVERGLRIAVIRELFEEAGILLGQSPDEDDHKSRDLEVRKAIEHGEMSFFDYIKQQNIIIDLMALTLFSRWQSPPHTGQRFDTYFYLAAAPKNQLAVADGREAVEMEWIKPTDALDLSANKQRKIIFPTRMNLKMLSETNGLGEAVDAAKLRKIQKVEPRVEVRGAEKYLVLDEDAGYGDVAELLPFK